MMMTISPSAKINGLARLAVVCCFLFNSPVASAVPVTIDFDDQPVGSSIVDLTSNNFTFSPSCHYDLEDRTDGGATVISKWIGFDFSGCYDGSAVGYNHDYIGPAGVGSGGRLYVAPAIAGHVFDLTSFDFVTIDPNSNGFHLKSSNGGDGTYDWSGGNLTHYDFSGPQWTNLAWLVFSSSAGAPAGFDNLALDVREVDEPGSLAIFLLCLLALRYAVVRKPNAPA
ncbi:MAG: hypothetical protein V4724_01540 [Pseudomonadota bacterium]